MKLRNKAVSRLVSVNEVQVQYQIYLINLSSMRVENEGKIYHYILSLSHVFSRFQWLEPLESKYPPENVLYLNRIDSFHGPPKNLQSNRCTKFTKEVKDFCKQRKIKKISSQAYHSQLQGKVERSYRKLRNKIHN